MDTMHLPVICSATPIPVDELSADLPILATRLLALAIARMGDRDGAADLVRATLIIARQAGATSDPRGAAVVDVTRLRVAAGGRPGRAAPGDRGERPCARPAIALPVVPADLAADRPIAAALVRAGAPTAPPAPPTGQPRAPRRRRRRPTASGAAAPAIPVARYDRLLAQLGERARAAIRAARRLEQARHRHDRAGDPAAEAALGAAALAHERALATCRALARQLGDLLTMPGLADALAGRERPR